jgi:hypothetical protein
MFLKDNLVFFNRQDAKNAKRLVVLDTHNFLARFASWRLNTLMSNRKVSNFFSPPGRSIS